MWFTNAVAEGMYRLCGDFNAEVGTRTEAAEAELLGTGTEPGPTFLICAAVRQCSWPAWRSPNASPARGGTRGIEVHTRSTMSWFPIVSDGVCVNLSDTTCRVWGDEGG